MIKEGFADFEATSWQGLANPGKWPTPVARKINEDVNKVLAMADMQKLLGAHGAEGVGGTPEKFAKFIRSETANSANVVEESGIRLGSQERSGKALQSSGKVTPCMLGFTQIGADVQELKKSDAAANGHKAYAPILTTQFLSTRYWVRSSNTTQASLISIAAERAGIHEASAWAAASALDIGAHHIPRLLRATSALRALDAAVPAASASDRQTRITALQELANEHAAVRTQAAPTATPPSEMSNTELRALFDRPLPDRLQRDLETRWTAIDAQRAQLSRRIDFGNPNHPETRQLNEALLASRMALSRSHYPQAVGQEVANRSIDNWLGVERAVTQMAGRGEKLSLDNLKAINQALGSGLSLGRSSTGAAQSYGEYRTQPQGPVGAGQRQYLDPQGQNIEQAMTDFMGWLQGAERSGMHPVQMASQAYMRLSSIHPFPDANGRTGRMAMNWILQSHGYPPAGLEPQHMPRMFSPERSSVVPEPGAAEREVTESVERSLSVAEAQLNR